MEKTITLRNYAGKKFDVKIEDFEDVKELFCHIIAGDEILHIERKNGKSQIIDTEDLSKEFRILADEGDLYDGGWNIPLDKIDEFSARESSLDSFLGEAAWE